MHLIITSKTDFIITLMVSLALTAWLYRLPPFAPYAILASWPGLLLFVSSVWGFVFLKILAVQCIGSVAKSAGKRQ